jgi:hypothetical protein
MDIDQAPKTQKARGVLALMVQRDHYPRPQLITDIEAYSQTDFRILQADAGGRALFARPCPTTPRHGFVDSRQVRTYSELVAVWEETMLADPEGEVILMPFVPSKWSAVVTELSMAIGPDHDGATAGHKSRILALAGLSVGWAKAYVLEGEVPYIEAVSTLSKEGLITSKLVQVRSGPQTKPPGDWVPKDVKIKRLLKAEGDALEWERIVTEAGVAKGDGTVVWHPGGTMLAHYAVHCSVHGIPILFGKKKPEVGQRIKATGVAPLRWNTRSFRRGVAVGLTYPLHESNRVGAVHFLCFVLHHASSLLTQPTGAWLVGAASVLMIRLGFAASIGEVRHAYKDDNFSKERSYVYEKSFASFGSFCSDRAEIGSAWWIFDECVWKGGYGGKKWGSCVAAVVDLEIALRVAAKGEDKGGKLIISALNAAVNQAHNNGWWMNKFADGNLFAELSEGDIKRSITSGVFAYTLLNSRPAGAGTNLITYLKLPPIEQAEPAEGKVGGKAHVRGASYEDDVVADCYECDCSPCECCQDCEQSPACCSCECECEHCGQVNCECEVCNDCDEKSNDCECPKILDGCTCLSCTQLQEQKDAKEHWSSANALARKESGLHQGQYQATCVCKRCSAFKEIMEKAGYNPKYKLSDVMEALLAKPSQVPWTKAGEELPATAKEADVPILMYDKMCLIPYTCEPRLQFCLRGNWVAHFQAGKLDSYSTYDIKVPVKLRKSFRLAMYAMDRTRSLANTTTPYWVPTTLAPFEGEFRSRLVEFLDSINLSHTISDNQEQT